MIRANTDLQYVAAGTEPDAMRRVLVAQRRELLQDVQRTIRTVRENGAAGDHQATNPDGSSDAELEDDLAFALIQMKGQVLRRVNQAIQRLDEGTYGYCVDCAEAIAPARLAALPFAVRCKDCEELREHADGGESSRSLRLSPVITFDTGH